MTPPSSYGRAAPGISIPISGGMTSFWDSQYNILCLDVKISRHFSIFVQTGLLRHILNITPKQCWDWLVKLCIWWVTWNAGVITFEWPGMEWSLVCDLEWSDHTWVTWNEVITCEWPGIKWSHVCDLEWSDHMCVPWNGVITREWPGMKWSHVSDRGWSDHMWLTGDEVITCEWPGMKCWQWEWPGMKCWQCEWLMKEWSDCERLKLRYHYVSHWGLSHHNVSDHMCVTGDWVITMRVPCDVWTLSMKWFTKLMNSRFIISTSEVSTIIVLTW